MKSRWKGCWAFRMGQPCFWLPAILIFSAGNCKEHLSYTFFHFFSSKSFDFLLQNRTICLHLHVEAFGPPSPRSGCQFCSPLGLFCALIPWEVAGSFLLELSTLPSAGILPRTFSPADKKPSLTHFFPAHLLAIACCFCPCMGFPLSHCIFFCSQLGLLCWVHHALSNLGSPALHKDFCE